MRDPLPKNTYKNPYQHPSGGGYSQGSNKSAGGFQGSGKRNESDYCWNFNKGVPCKFGAKCKFIERCKYCDSPSHGVNNCQKLQKKTGGQPNTAGSSSAADKQICRCNKFLMCYQRKFIGVYVLSLL